MSPESENGKLHAKVLLTKRSDGRKCVMHSIRIRSTSPLVDADFMNIDETDFAAMSRPEQIRHFEVEGYLVLPSILTPDVIGRLKKELAHAEMSHTSYSTQQTRSVEQPQWLSRTAAELIGYPPVIDFLTDLMGPDIVFTRGFSEIAARVSRHLDAHGWSTTRLEPVRLRGELPAAGASSLLPGHADR